MKSEWLYWQLTSYPDREKTNLEDFIKTKYLESLSPVGNIDFENKNHRGLVFCLFCYFAKFLELLILFACLFEVLFVYSKTTAWMVMKF